MEFIKVNMILKARKGMDKELVIGLMGHHTQANGRTAKGMDKELLNHIKALFI